MSNQAKEILEYCITYLGNGEIPKDFKTNKKYKDMVKEIDFIAEGVLK